MTTTRPLPDLHHPVVDRYRRWDPVWFNFLKPLFDTLKRVETEEIVADRIAAGAITSEKIAAGAVTATAIAADAITAAKIAAGAVGASEIAAGAVTATKISVTTLSTVSQNAGTITAGVIQSSNGKVVLDLTNGTFTISS